MKNPYEVLGINENASIDEIKKAYRAMAKKYHPDQFTENPLIELAEEKMRDINEAYDYLMKNHSSSNSYSQNYNSGSYKNSSNGENSDYMNYQSIRMDIQNNNLRDAEAKLNRITTRNAEWHFLMGVLSMKKGWYDGALNHLNTAYNLDPNNPEYKETYYKIQNMNNSYRQPYRNRNSSDNDMCRLCTTLYCADCLCECCGGDLISCC
ncbi:DnaJ domain-containing protein [Haloimpatiens sp. FM7315]|uniref:J domain-containing protein n=1 Tax=Haloimpatiens sp. FM7315 TaxID=3298609 RepID=UPI0035A2677D